MDFSKARLNLSLPEKPLIYLWIKNRLDKCETPQDYIDFIDHCLDQYDDSNNEVRKKAYLKTSNALYSKICNISWESSLNEILGSENI